MRSVCVYREPTLIECWASRKTQIPADITCRPFSEADWPQLWPIIEAVAQSGDCFPYPPFMDERVGRSYWIDQPEAVYVATIADRIVGSYYLKPNQPFLGAHVANAGYVVGEHARGQGVARIMCGHSLRQARFLGYLAMQFNLVVSTNHTAVRLWQNMGFEIVGTLPKAFEHISLGFVDAYIMHKFLDDDFANDG